MSNVHRKYDISLMSRGWKGLLYKNANRVVGKFALYCVLKVGVPIMLNWLLKSS